MRAKEGARLRLGDWVQLSTGRFAGAQGEVVEVILTHPRVGRARLRLPSGDDYWHPFWNEPMNDAEWRYTTDAEEMERYLHGLEGVASRRKWLLFVCGFIRLRPGNAHGDVERLMVEVLERYADEEIELASLRQFSRRLPLGDLIGLIAGGIDSLSSLRTYLLAIGIAIEEQAFERSNLLREIFGNPFRRPVLDPTWLAWESGQIPKLAREIYDSRRFADMRVLGDALQDAGCRDDDVLSHCRSASPHVRGCWLLDALLGLDGVTK